ncbi:hypothetical protein F5B19DRAFT_480743 [Rostrohypoxylon terebratum]|nr:hypothetical protein F5B19DRAFT_480743 [Rostrohypoxylon terebratum]
MSRHYQHKIDTEDDEDLSLSTSHVPCNIRSVVFDAEGEHNIKDRLSAQAQGSKVSETQNLPHDRSSVLEGDIISHCLDSIRSALSNAASYLAQEKKESKDQFLESYTRKLRREAERLHLWSNGSLFKGNDRGVSSLLSTDLGLPVLCRLFELGAVARKCLLPSIHIQQSAAFPILQTEMDNLDLKLEPILQILQENNQEVVDYSLPDSTEDPSDLLGPLDEIHVLIDCLMDLSLAIEDFLETPNGSLPLFPQRQSQEDLIGNGPITQKDKQNASEWGIIAGGSSRVSCSREKQQKEVESEAPEDFSDVWSSDSYSSSYSSNSTPSTSSVSSKYSQYDTAIERDWYKFQEPATAYALPCEFYAIGGCGAFFNYADVDAWIEHIVIDHLQDKLPEKADCWFCTTYSFNVKDPRVPGDRQLNFQNRMHHIHSHIGDGKTENDMVPDFHMLDHLLKHNLISEGRYNEVRRWQSLPTPNKHLKGFHKPDFVPPRRTAERPVRIHRIN